MSLEKKLTRRDLLKGFAIGIGTIATSQFLQACSFVPETKLPEKAVKFQEELIEKGQQLDIADIVVIGKGATRLRWFASPVYSDDIYDGPAVVYKGNSGNLTEQVYHPWTAIDHQKGQAWLVYQSAIDGKFTAVYLDEQNLAAISTGSRSDSKWLVSELGSGFDLKPFTWKTVEIDKVQESSPLLIGRKRLEIYVKDKIFKGQAFIKNEDAERFKVMYSDLISA